jgi:hypothetical protein
MQIETPTRSDFSSNREVVEQGKDVQGTDDNAELEWLLSYQVREQVLWPRVFPGL